MRVSSAVSTTSGDSADSGLGLTSAAVAISTLGTLLPGSMETRGWSDSRGSHPASAESKLRKRRSHPTQR